MIIREIKDNSKVNSPNPIQKIDEKIRWAFFGSSNFSIIVLNNLESFDILPNLIITTPDKARGRGLNTTGSPVKMWAEERKIPVLAPDSLKTPYTYDKLYELGNWDIFLIASYGKIVPIEILNIPEHGTLNIHPSLLPKYRGPTPLETAILNDSKTGVTLMKVDEQVDHGQIIAQKNILITDWPPYYKNLEKLLAIEGAKLFAETIPKWLEGEIQAKEQDHAIATHTKKFTKDDLLINFADAPKQNLRKIRAFSRNRNAYFITQHKTHNVRISVIEARIENEKLILETIKPEGKREMGYEDYKRGLK